MSSGLSQNSAYVLSTKQLSRSNCPKFPQSSPKTTQPGLSQQLTSPHMVSVSVQGGFCRCGRHHGHKQWGKGYFILQITGYSPWLREARSGALNRTLKQNHRRQLFTELRSGPHSGTLLVQPRSTCPGMVPLQVGWTLLGQLAIKKMPHVHDHRPI